MTSSMLQDLQRGKPLELDYLSGTVVAIGQRHGIPTPAHAEVVAKLAPMKDGAAETPA